MKRWREEEAEKVPLGQVYIQVEELRSRPINTIELGGGQGRTRMREKGGLRG